MKRQATAYLAQRGAILLALVAVGLSACTEQDTYPVTGIECGPNDPVQTIGDCSLPVR